MTNAHRDLATPEPWARSLERSRRRRALLPKARRENRRRKHVSAALATAVVAGPGYSACRGAGDLRRPERGGGRGVARQPRDRDPRGRPPAPGGQPGRPRRPGAARRCMWTRTASSASRPTPPCAATSRRRGSTWTESSASPPGARCSGQAHGAATGAAIGGSNIPAAAQATVEQTVQQAGSQLGAQGDTGFRPAGRHDRYERRGHHRHDRDHRDRHGSRRHHTRLDSGSRHHDRERLRLVDDLRPVSGPVTSPFGPRGGRNHDGMDIGAPTGTPVRAAACGTVSLAGQQSGYGNIVCITHTSQFSTCYAHLSRFGTSTGAHVQQGQVIGYVGCTGNCTGPHLHFETRVGGVARNPTQYLGGASMPGSDGERDQRRARAARARRSSASAARASRRTSDRRRAGPPRHEQRRPARDRRHATAGDGHGRHRDRHDAATGPTHGHRPGTDATGPARSRPPRPSRLRRRRLPRRRRRLRLRRRRLRPRSPAHRLRRRRPATGPGSRSGPRAGAGAPPGATAGSGAAAPAPATAPALRRLRPPHHAPAPVGDALRRHREWHGMTGLRRPTGRRGCASADAGRGSEPAAVGRARSRPSRRRPGGPA